MEFSLTLTKMITNAAMVLFCTDPLPQFPGSVIVLGYFKDQAKRNMIDSQRIHGHLFQLLDDALDFLYRHTSVASYFKADRVQRVDKPDYPPLALREALLNALAHRDYRIVGGSVSVMLYLDHLDIISHGALPRGITVEQLTSIHSSSPRNPLIANVLYRCGYIETMGTGTQEMIYECDQEQLPHPLFHEDSTTFRVTFNREPMTVSIVHSAVEVPLTVRQQAILDFLEMHPHSTNRTILQALVQEFENISGRTLSRELSHLSTLQFIQSIGKGRAKRWQKIPMKGT